jgi:hypothetical protein
MSVEEEESGEDLDGGGGGWRGSGGTALRGWCGPDGGGSGR